MRVGITGATGFLGARVCALLKDAGYDVVAFGRDVAKANGLKKMGVDFACDDLRFTNPQVLSHEIGKLDTIVHAGGLSSAWGRKKDFYSHNVVGTRNTLELARYCHASRFVFISSPSIGFRFRDQLDVTDAFRARKPVNHYAWSKAEAEKIVLNASDLDPIVLRPRGIYGPGDRALLPRLVRAAAHGPLPLLRRGRATTNLTFIDDAAQAVLDAVAAQRDLPERVFNIAGNECLLVKDVVDAAAERAGVTVRWRSVSWPVARASVGYLETIARLLSPSKEPPITAFGLGMFAFSQTLDTRAARRHLSFAPAVSFVEGLERTFERGRDDGPAALF